MFVLAAIAQSLLTLEGLAVVLALAYLLLAARESLWCWLCALINSLLYVWIFWQAKLYTETVLNVFYVVMAVIGWQQWQRGSADSSSDKHKRAIVSFRPWQHVACLALTLVLAFANGYVMQRYTQAAWPFVDAFIAWGSVITTFMVVRKVLENWLYWIVLDGIAVVVYVERGLYLTALLFVGYVIIVVFGYLRWRREYQSAPMQLLPPE
jgi:nicotinamide mononucleotide transporter